MKSIKEKLQNVAVPLFSLTLILFLIYMGARYLLPVLLPFLVAYFLAIPVRRMSHEIAKKIRLPYRMVGLFLILLLLGLVFSFLGYLGYRLVSEGMEGLRYLSDNPETVTEIYDTVQSFFANIVDKIPLIGGQAEGRDGVNEMLREGIYEIIKGLLGYIGGLVEHLPSVLVSVIVTVITAVYCVVDEERVDGLLFSAFSERGRERAMKTENQILSVLGKCVRAYLVIFVMNLIFLAVGLSVLRVEYAVLLAFVFSLVDLLPVVGIGLALIPWGIYSIAVGKTAFGIALLAMYLVITVLRQLIEPRLVGQGTGLHPLLILVSLVVGGRLFGLFGLILFPAALLIYCELKKERGEKLNGGGEKTDSKGEKRDTQEKQLNIPHRETDGRDGEARAQG